MEAISDILYYKGEVVNHLQLNEQNTNVNDFIASPTDYLYITEKCDI